MASQKFFIFSFLVALVSGGSQIDFDNDKSQNGIYVSSEFLKRFFGILNAAIPDTTTTTTTVAPTLNFLENPPVVLAPSGEHTATIIFLHGLGDTGHTWASAINNIRPSHVKVICPTANQIPVTINSGQFMNSWFDVVPLYKSLAGQEDEDGIKRAAKIVDLLIEEEMKNGIPSERIMIGGFGAGGALSLYTAFHTSHKLAGVIALSSWIPLYREIGDATKVNKEIPYLQTQGDSDSIVPYELGQLVSYLLQGMLPNHEFKLYEGLGHSTNEEEIRDVEQFIAKCLPYHETSVKPNYHASYETSKVQPNYHKTATVQPVCPMNSGNCRSALGEPITCGISVQQHGRIVNGSSAIPGSHPWAVQVWSDRLLCSAVLITNQFAITVAHCLLKTSQSDIFLVLGNLNTEKSQYEEKRKIDKVYSHEDFDIRSFDNDIALIKMDEPVEFNDRIRPICLPAVSEDYAGVYAKVIGWGSTDYDEDYDVLPTELQEVTVPVLPQHKCKYETKFKPDEIKDNMLCAGYDEGMKDACLGDSGGPLIKTEETHKMLIGIVSWGEECARPGLPGVYTRVGSYLEWIKHILEEEEDCVCDIGMAK